MSKLPKFEFSLLMLCMKVQKIDIRFLEIAHNLHKYNYEKKKKCSYSKHFFIKNNHKHILKCFNIVNSSLLIISFRGKKNLLKNYELFPHTIKLNCDDTVFKLKRLFFYR